MSHQKYEDEDPSAALNLIPFSISQYTEGKLNGKTLGIVELQIIYLLNKTISLKEKWVSLMEIVLASRNHLHRSFIPEEEETFEVDCEKTNDKGESYILMPDLANYDSTVYQTQKHLRKFNSLLSRVLHRYNLNTSLPAIQASGYQFDNPLNWRKISFKTLKTEFIIKFEGSPKVIPFKLHPFDDVKLSKEGRQKRKQLVSLPMPAQLNVRSSVAGAVSPFTPLTHTFGNLKYLGGDRDND